MVRGCHRNSVFFAETFPDTFCDHPPKHQPRVGQPRVIYFSSATSLDIMNLFFHSQHQRLLQYRLQILLCFYHGMNFPDMCRVPNAGLTRWSGSTNGQFGSPTPHFRHTKTIASARVATKPVKMMWFSLPQEGRGSYWIASPTKRQNGSARIVE